MKPRAFVKQEKTPDRSYVDGASMLSAGISKVKFVCFRLVNLNQFVLKKYLFKFNINTFQTTHITHVTMNDQHNDQTTLNEKLGFNRL